MSSASRIASLAAAVAVLGAAACSNDGPTSAPSPSAPSFSKSGTAPSGGDRKSGGGSDNTDKSATSGPPVAPSYTAKIDSIGEVPTLMYYGTPSVWKIGGYIFESGYLTHLKPLAGPLVVGACVSVTFSQTITGAYFASEIKTESASKCG